MKKRILAVLAAFSVMTTVMYTAGLDSVSAYATEKKKESGDDLGKDLYAYKIKIDGKVYSLPVKLQDFLDDGWSLEADEEGTDIPPMRYTLASPLQKGSKRMYIQVSNIASNDTIKIEEGYVTQVTVDTPAYKKDKKDEFLNFELPGGIKESSSKEDVIKAFGEPTNENDTGDYTYLTYNEDIQKEVRITIDNKDKSVTTVEVNNFAEVSEDDAKSEDKKSDDKKSDDKKDTKAEETKADDKKDEKSDDKETKAEETKADDKKDTKAEETKADDKKDEKSDDKKDVKSDTEKDTKAEETKADDKKSEKEDKADTSGIFKYAEPKKIGDDFFKFNLEIEGKMMNLPMPASELESVGFESENIPDKVPARSFVQGKYEKDGKQMNVMITNFSDKEKDTSDCLVTFFSVSQLNDPQIEIEAAKGIKTGVSTLDDVEKAFDGTNVETEETSTLKFFTLKKDNRRYIKVTVDTDKDKVIMIEMENYNKALKVED